MDIAVATGNGADFREAIYRMRRHLKAAPVPTSPSNNLQDLIISWEQVRGQTLIANSRISRDLAVSSVTLICTKYRCSRCDGA